MFLSDPRAAYERALLAATALLACTALLGASLLLDRVLGFAGCELCVMQRWPHALAILVSATALGVAHARPAVYSGLMYATAAVLAAGAVVACYHSGVEAGAWSGPSSCTGAGILAHKDVGSLVEALKATRVVRCDVPALRIAGLSLANWNTIASIALALASVAAARPVARARLVRAAGA